jgi:hypothetical protein
MRRHAIKVTRKVQGGMTNKRVDWERGLPKPKLRLSQTKALEQAAHAGGSKVGSEARVF